MEFKVYVGNLSKSTTQEELNTLFTQAGDVTAVNIIMDFKRGESKGFAFVTMSAQSEADKAVSMFNSYSLDEHQLRWILPDLENNAGWARPTDIKI